MNLKYANEILYSPRPTDEESVDLCCSACAGFWNSRSSCIHNLGDNAETEYKNFVGRENVELTDNGFIYYCPNGCTNFIGEKVELQDAASLAILTPQQQWDYANDVVKHYELSKELEELEAKIKNWEAYG